MRVDKEIGPSLDELRPVKTTRTATFPVHADLVSVLADTKTHPDETVASVLAVLAGYAYSESGTVPVMMARMGLAENHCLTVAEDVDAMLIKSTAFLVQSRDGRVALLGYRGTEPANSINWLTDLDVSPERVAFFPGTRPPAEVHAGFYRNVRATRFELAAALRRALAGRSVLDDGRPTPWSLPNDGRMEHPLEALYLAGHSLGGAMASLMAVMMVTDEDYRSEFYERLRAVYTYGQPMIGSPGLASACEKDAFLSRNVIRYVYRHDVVPHLPPWLSGDFAHFGREYRFNGTWQETKRPSRQVRNVVGLLGALTEFLAGMHRGLRNIPFQHSATDHYPHRYIAALTPPGKPTEFGDHPYTAR
jgi:hypothetical protein